MNIIFFHPRHDNFRGFFSSIFVKRPVNLDYMIFPLILDVIFWICAEANIVPLNLKRKDFISHAVLQIVKELILINYNCKVLIKLLLLIFYEYLSKFVLVSLVRFCDAVGNSLINLQVWALYLYDILQNNELWWWYITVFQTSFKKKIFTIQGT